MPISRIKTDGIQDDAITSAKIGVDVIVADDLAANSVTVSELTDGAVTSAKLDTNIAVSGTLSSGGAMTATGEFKSNGGVIFNEDSADLDFRVESNGNANMLFVDGGNDRVGIGTSSPASLLHIKSSTVDARLQLTNSASADDTTNSGASFQLFNDDLYINAVENSGNIILRTDGGGGFVERMRITSAGKVGLGIDPSTLPSFISHAMKIVNGGGLSITSPSSSDNRYIFFGTGTSSSDVQLAAIKNSSSELMFLGASGAERMRINSSGNVGIGTDSPLTLADNAAPGLTISSNGPFILLKDANNANNIRYISNNTGEFQFGKVDDNGSSNKTEHMRITSAGDLLLNKTTAQEAGDGFFVKSDGVFAFTGSVTTSGPLGYFYNEGSTANGFRYASFRLGAFAEVGTITTNGSSSVSYNTSSDYRLKENVEYDFDATTRLKQLKPARFNFITDADTTVDGFLAHEVQSVVPEAITGTHDEVDDDGNPVYQGIDQSKLVPLLVKTIQELEARITALESN